MLQRLEQQVAPCCRFRKRVDRYRQWATALPFALMALWVLAVSSIGQWIAAEVRSWYWEFDHWPWTVYTPTACGMCGLVVILLCLFQLTNCS
jgi:hypothetical protein